MQTSPSWFAINKFGFASFSHVPAVRSRRINVGIDKSGKPVIWDDEGIAKDIAVDWGRRLQL
jgi:hypothetical protein